MSDEKGIARVDAQPIELADETLHKLMLKGDIAGLKENELCQYYQWYCHRLGLDPATQPFQVLDLKGKKVLYAGRGCCAQLTQKNRISHQIIRRELIGHVYVVTGRASLPDGRFVDSTGAVSVKGLDGEALANAYMKAETKCKRRATLDLVGLGCTDETEVASIPGAETLALPEPLVDAGPAISGDLPPPSITTEPADNPRGGPDEPPLTDGEAPADSTVAPEDPEAMITAGRLKALIMVQEEAHVQDFALKEHLKQVYHITSRKLIKNKDYKAIRTWVAKGGADKTEREEIEGAFVK